MRANAKRSPAGEPASSRGPLSRLPPLKALLAFSAAARHSSFRQGAEELGVTPSAVSHQLQQLEEFLGVPLFQRQAGRAVLTNAGATYAAEIERALTWIADATRLIAPQSQRGHLVIASGPSFAAKWLQPRLPDFLNANPDVKVRISTLADRDDVESARFDIAIAYGSPPSGMGHVEPLFTERLRPLCAPTLAASLHLTAPGDLERATLIHSVNALSWTDYLRRIGSADVRAANELWLDRSSIAIDAAVRGIGVVLESELLAAGELNDRSLVAPFGAAHTVEVTTYFLVRSKASRPESRAAAFETWLRHNI